MIIFQIGFTERKHDISLVFAELMHSAEIAEIAIVEILFDKKFVEVTFLLKKLLETDSIQNAKQ